MPFFETAAESEMNSLLTLRLAIQRLCDRIFLEHRGIVSKCSPDVKYALRNLRGFVQHCDNFYDEFKSKNFEYIPPGKEVKDDDALRREHDRRLREQSELENSAISNDYSQSHMNTSS